MDFIDLLIKAGIPAEDLQNMIIIGTYAEIIIKGAIVYVMGDKIIKVSTKKENK